jgi:hypothetical protein
MGMQAVVTFWRLTGSPDIEPDLFADMHMLVSAFRYTATNNGEVFLLVAARGVGIDESCLAWYQSATPDNVLFHILRGHYILSLVIDIL